MADQLYQVDAFSGDAFKGNPAAVVMLNHEKHPEWMRNFAMEMNLSETAFLKRIEDSFSLRWFTPAVEVDLCGHATLASAHVIYSEGFLDTSETITFLTKKGKLFARFETGWITLDFPAFSLEDITMDRQIKKALGFLPNRAYQTDRNLLVEVKDIDELKKFTPDLEELVKLPFQGLIVTTQMQDGKFDFASRYFAPQAGIDEDPVTGSAHCSLAPYWSERLSKSEFMAYQASQRGGILKVKLADDRVLIGGQAVTIFSGKLRI